MTEQSFTVVFPVQVHFADGSCDSYAGAEALEHNLEFFNPDVDIDYEVTDAFGRPVRLIIDRLKIEVLELASKAD